MLDKNKCPYGIIVSSVAGNDTEVYGKLTPKEEEAQREVSSKDSKFKCRTWWRYPYESVSIDDAYPRNDKEGWFTFLITKPTTLAEVCYFNRAKEGKVFPSIAYREDGTLDPKKTVYYGKLAK